MKKVAFMVTALDSGGIENYLLRFLLDYHQVISATIYCKGNYVGQLENKFKELNVTIIPFKLGYFNLVGYLDFYRELKTQNYNAIVDFTGNMGGAVVLVAKFASVDKRIVFYRNASTRFKTDFFRTSYDRLMKLLVQLNSTKILANSKSGFDFYFKNKWSNNPKYKVIYNGIDSIGFTCDKVNLRKELGLSSQDFVIGHIGRYNAAKNHETILKVAERLCYRHKNVHFLLCGDKVDLSLKSRVAKLKLDRVILLPYNEKVIQVLNTCDAFYFPSITEGQPNALIEAMIAGLPFVASNIPSIRETVDERYHTQLVPPLSVEASVNKLEELYTGETTFTLKEWATENFSSELLFLEFFKEL